VVNFVFVNILCFWKSNPVHFSPVISDTTQTWKQRKTLCLL